MPREAGDRGRATRSRKAREGKKTAAEAYRDALQANAEAFAAARVKCALDETVSWPERLKAMEALENRALGRPTEHVQTEDVSSKQAADLGYSELVQRMREAVKASS